MSRSRVGPVPDEQRTKIEERHTAELTALAAHAAAADRLALAEARRVDVIADQDQRIAEARAERMDAAAVLVRLIGVDRAADLTGLTVAELRRCTRPARTAPDHTHCVDGIEEGTIDE